MNDSEIIGSILAGNHDNFRMLVEKYQQMVFSIAMGFVHNKEEAEDLTQDIFIRVYRSLGKFRGESLFSTWLTRITINACLNHTRKISVNLILNRITLASGRRSDKEPQITLYEENPEEMIIREEHRAWLQKALDTLPEKQRTAIILSKYDDLPQKEIAEIMNLTEGAVEALLQRAKKNLREKLSSTSKKNEKDRRKN